MGIEQLADACEKCDLYGYWEARLKDGFHFDAVRQLAQQRLEHSRAIAKLLADEMKEDAAPFEREEAICTELIPLEDEILAKISAD